MEKDIISVICDDDSTEEMEVCLFVNLHSSNKGCMIYKKLAIPPEYFAAHYTNNNLEHSTLDYDFTDDEKEELNVIFKELVEA